MNQSKKLKILLSEPDKGYFTEDFNREIPFLTIKSSIERLNIKFGSIVKVVQLNNNIWNVECERGSYDISANFDENDYIDGLSLPTITPSLLSARIPFLIIYLFILLFFVGVFRVWNVESRFNWLQYFLPTSTLGFILISIAVWAKTFSWMKHLIWSSMALIFLSAIRLLEISWGQIDLLAIGGGIVFFLIGIPIILQSYQGNKLDSETINLGKIISGTDVMITHGGSNSTTNYHSAYQHMKYAIDCVGVGKMGFYSKGILPVALEKYSIYGAQVLAPLSGRVTGVRSDLPDLRVPQTDNIRPAGNYITISCIEDNREVQILMAHLMQDSICVRVGDKVDKGEVLARVGNSGNTSEPHLHLGVSVEFKEGEPLSGKGIAFKIDSEFPTRGKILKE